MLWSRIEAKLPLVVLFIGRTIRIVILALLFIPAFFLARLVRPSAGPHLLRWYLQACGAAFVKLGQVLAMRYDLLPAAYCEELSKLLDQLPPVPIGLIVQAVEHDLARSLSACYLEFEASPLASASIAQVHKAKLLDGALVVVKVMRPGVRHRFRIDLEYMKLIGRFLATFGPTRNLGVQRINNELIQLIQEELDFRREARNIHQMHGRMQQDEVD